MPKDRAGRSNADVTSERQVKRAAHAVALNACNRECRELVHELRYALAGARELVSIGRGERGDFFEVRARRKDRSTADYERQAWEMGAAMLHRRLEFQDDGARQPVPAVFRC